MIFEIHPATPTTEDRLVMEQAIQMLHEALKREIHSIESTEHPTGQMLMVHRDSSVSIIPDLSRTAKDGVEFLSQMRRVVASVKPAFVAYANLCEIDEKGTPQESIQVFAESARRAVAIGTSGVRRRGVHPPTFEPLKTEFMSHGDVLTTEFGAFYADLADEAGCGNGTLH
ncbi:MAG: hypothetical protein DDT34_02349 [Firmicutes bacterium]|nr:hypothetical protein [Bacillota bacterium]